MILTARKSANPLDKTMTKTQVVRRKFMSSLPRRSDNRILSPMEAMGRTMQLFDTLRGEMRAAGLDANNARAALVYCQPETKGMAGVLAQVVELPKPEGIPAFCKGVLALDKPLFLGVMFLQHDPDTDKREYTDRIFVAPFMTSPEAEGRLIAARGLIAKGGAKRLAN